MSASRDLPDETGVAVLGGGIMGAATAFFLAERGVDVALLERDAVGAGSTGDSSAILRHHYGGDEGYTRMAAWSHEFYREFEDRTGAPLSYEARPMVRVAEAGTDGAAFARAGYRTLSEMGLPVSLYEGSAVAEQYPDLAVEGYDLAVSDDGAAYADGSDAASGFARAAARAGGTVVTGVEAERIETSGGRVSAVETDAGRLDCSHAVATLGPWTAPFVDHLGVEVPITTSREAVLVLDPQSASGVRDRLPTVSIPGENWYLRPDFGGRVLVATHHAGPPCDPDRYDRTPEESTVLDLGRAVGEFVPALADARVVGRYCGVYARTPDNDFVVDAPGPEGFVLACGFSGHGFKHGPAVGRMAADLVLDGGTDLVDVDRFRLDRFAGGSEGNVADERTSEYDHRE